MPHTGIQSVDLLLDRADRGWHNRGMTTTAHRDCTHPATKSARALCRRMRAAAATTRALTLAAIIESYDYGNADLELIAEQVACLDHDLATPYYNNSLDAEEFITSLRDAARARP